MLAFIPTTLSINAYEERDEEDAIDGAHEIAPPHDAHGQQQQEDVDEEVRQVGMYARGIEDQGGDTAHAAADDAIGQQEAGVAQRVDDESGRHLGVVLGQLPGVGPSAEFLNQFFHKLRAL